MHLKCAGLNQRKSYMLLICLNFWEISSYIYFGRFVLLIAPPTHGLYLKWRAKKLWNSPQISKIQIFIVLENCQAEQDGSEKDIYTADLRWEESTGEKKSTKQTKKISIKRISDERNQQVRGNQQNFLVGKKLPHWSIS